MRGYKIIELNWSSSKSKIDVVATKNNRILFMEVTSATKTPIDFKSRSTKLVNSADSWLKQNKYSGQFGYGTIQLANDQVLSFSSDALY